MKQEGTKSSPKCGGGWAGGWGVHLPRLPASFWGRRSSDSAGPLSLHLPFAFLCVSISELACFNICVRFSGPYTKAKRHLVFCQANSCLLQPWRKNQCALGFTGKMDVSLPSVIPSSGISKGKYLMVPNNENKMIIGIQWSLEDVIISFVVKLCICRTDFIFKLPLWNLSNI